MEKLVKRIYYHDTDCGGVVYYANYLKYCEEARTEYLRKKGLDLKNLSEEKGILFVVRKVDIDYKSPARYNDILDIYTDIIKIRNVSLDFFQEIKIQDKVLVQASTTLVSINTQFNPVPIPEEITGSLRLN